MPIREQPDIQVAERVVEQAVEQAVEQVAEWVAEVLQEQASCCRSWHKMRNRRAPDFHS